jgi:hypothetical protein
MEIEIELNSVQEVEVLTNVANKLTDLIDVNSTGITTSSFNYVLAYDTTASEFKFINPDDVLVSAASTDPTLSNRLGLPTEFLDRLDLDLDNRINIDAGSF